MVDLALAKLQMNVEHDDDDVLIQQYIDTATLDVERLSGQLMTRREVTSQVSSFDSWLPLDWGPNPEAVIVSYFDASDAPAEISDARVVRDRLYPPSTSWPEIATDSVIEVTYTAGWEEEPADLVSAVLLLVAGMYQDREGAYEAAQEAAERICSRSRAMTV
jgi:uncharacterized phiE125 gp8 family phage protein